MSDVEDYFNEKGIDVKQRQRVRGKVNLVIDCPLCGAKTTRTKRRFWICSETGVFICNECGEKGNLYLLKKLLGDLVPVAPLAEPSGFEIRLESQISFEQPEKLIGHESLIQKWCDDLLGDEFARKWLIDGRGIGEEWVRKFKLGVVFRQGRRWLSVPYFVKEKVVLVKYRSIEGEKAFQRVSDCPSPLFNLDSLKGEWKRVYVTEGELDAVSMEAMGLAPAVSLPAGAGYVSDDIKAALESVDDVYICTDMDNQGNSAARKLAESLGPYRCYRVSLPQKDANDCLSAGLESDVRAAVDNAQAMGLGQVMGLADALDVAVSSGAAMDKGWSTGLYDLDLILGGLRRSEWTVVSGDTGSGKTVTQMMLGTNLVKRGVGVMLACLELHPNEVAIRWASQILGENIHKMSTEDKKSAAGRIKSIGSTAFLVPKKGYVSTASLGGMLEYCVRRHGVGVLSVDHLDYIVKDVDDLREINSAVMAFDSLVTKFHVHGILGAHPSKTESIDKKGSPRRVRMGDIRGSSKIKQLAYNILIVDPEDEKTKKKVLRVEKRRWTGNTVAIPARMTCRFHEKSIGIVDDRAKPGDEFKDYKMLAAGE